MGYFLAGAFVGSLATFTTMVLVYCANDEGRINEELEEKHWNECRQIAHYEDENRRMKEQLEQLIKKYE